MKLYAMGVGLLLLVMLSTAHAQVNETISDENGSLVLVDDSVIVVEGVEDQIAGLHAELGQLAGMGIPTNRIADSILLVEQAFGVEEAAYYNDTTLLFSGTQSRIEETHELIDSALTANDEIAALEQRITEVEGEIDLGPVLEILNKAKGEMKNERFENVPDIAVQGHEKIVELQSFQTKAQAQAEAAQANVVGFIETHKVEIGAVLAAGLLLFLILRNRLRLWWIQNQLKGLELEKQTLRDEIKRAQDEFFRLGKINERLYHIREEVFGEMTREVNRKIAVRTEEERKMRIFSGGGILSHFSSKKPKK